MKKIFWAILVLSLAWSAPAWGQYGRGSSSYEADRQRRAYEDQVRQQEDQMRKQKYEMQEMERRARQAETDRDRMQSDRDFERYRHR